MTTDCHDSDRGEPVATLGYKGDELSILAIARRLCCTYPVRDSSRESSVVAGLHEQTHTPDLQNQELAGL